jgi:hypothetical protein
MLAGSHSEGYGESEGSDGMTVKQLIVALSTMEKQHGDLPVVFRDNMTLEDSLITDVCPSCEEQPLTIDLYGELQQ